MLRVAFAESDIQEGVKTTNDWYIFLGQIDESFFLYSLKKKERKKTRHKKKHTVKPQGINRLILL